MGEIIRLAEFQTARRRAARHHSDQQSLARALAIMRENLAAAAGDLCDATPDAQPELLDRIERLTALIRYGMQMVGEGTDPGDAGSDAIG